MSGSSATTLATTSLVNGSESVSQKCGNCKFFRRHLSNITEGFCKRMPPSVIIAPVRSKSGAIEPHPVSVTANMHQDDWCGEWQLKVTLQ